MSASFYRAAAADLDRCATDVDDADITYVAECRRRLPEVLQGAATAWLTDQLDGCSADLRHASSILRSAATAARSQAAAIEAAEAADAAQAAAEAAAADEQATDPLAPDLYF